MSARFYRLPSASRELGALALFLVNLSLASAEEIAAPGAAAPVDFAREIQPLLRKHCFSCHGEEVQEGGLRLDQKKHALAGGDSGPEIIPAKSADSRFARVIAGTDEDFGRMPPVGKGEPLAPEEIARVRAWIDQGAKWPDEAELLAAEARHWSLQPVSQPAIPVQPSNWPRGAIDSFILARLQEASIEPSAAADRSTLIRRLYLDLTGLLPTPAEVDAFLADERPDATERLIDRLLASPRFGERWGRHWMDLARYADSDGYEKDRPRPFAWRYRDWVISAINDDVPYDQFTIEQLAGDLLPAATLEQQIASGLHRNTLHNTEGGIDPEEDRVKKTVDRTNTLGTIWLGLTVGCAQCHTHKYDPITQREYYQLYALFNSLEEADIPAPTPEEAAALAQDQAAHDAQASELQKHRTEYETSQLAAAQRAWEAQLGTLAAVWEPLKIEAATSKHGATLTRQSDGSYLASGTNKLSDVYTIEATTELVGITALRLEVLPDDSLPARGPGRSNNGNFVLSRLRVQAAPASGEGETGEVAFTAARADFSQNEFTPDKALNDKPGEFWAISPQFGQRHVAVFEAEEPFGQAGGTKLTITLDQAYNKQQPHNLGRFRLSASTAAKPVPFEGIPAAIAAAAHTPAESRAPAQAKELADFYRGIDTELARLSKTIAEHEAKRPKLPEDRKAQAVRELAKPRATHLLQRGDFLSPGDEVQAGVPAVLPPLASSADHATRLDLARWLVDPAHPLTVRVTVNRDWQQLFGRGIVLTSDDFGKQGDPPSHPELLDWLARRLVDKSWSRKALLRTILASAAYQQSSAPRLDLASIDPENVLVARQARRRVEAELIRDLALAASGELVERIGGPSVRPPQPAEYAGLTYANSARWVESAGADRYRRGVYTFFQRTSPYPMLMTFDSPDSNECTARRQVSNTPLQALTLWNDPALFEAAQALGRRAVEEVPKSEEPVDAARPRAEHLFRLGLGRAPSQAETDDLLALYRVQRELALRDDVAARQTIGPDAPANAVEVAELAAWIAVARAVLNLDEFIHRE
jgi:hypothetical protein